MSLVLSVGHVGRVDVIGNPADDKAGEDNEERDGHLLLLGQHHVLLERRVELQALRMLANLLEHAHVAEHHDRQGNEDAGDLRDGVVDVAPGVVGVGRPALRRARLVVDVVEPRHRDAAHDAGPHPRGGHHQQDLVQLDRVAEWPRDRVVLVDADVHEGVDRGHQEEDVEEAVDLAQQVPQHPAAVDEGDDGEGHGQRAHAEVGHGEVDEEQVGSGAHAAVSNHHRDHHQVAHDRQERRDRQQGCHGDGEGQVPGAVVGAVAGGGVGERPGDIVHHRQGVGA